jgi:hypothetical protein
MHQTWHIFKKDCRYLRYEATVVWLIAIVFAAMHLRGPHRSSDLVWIPEVFLFIGVASIIGRLVLAEAIPGDRQFWITRPYRWQSLLGAKVLFLIAFVNLPVFLAQLAIVLIDGFPFGSIVAGLLWSQLLWFAFLLPFAAFATLSAAKPFHLILFGIAAAVWVLALSGEAGPLTGVRWVSQTIALLALVATAICILFLQYRSRRTVLSRCLAAVGITAATFVFVAMPWPTALAVESRLAPPNALGSSIQASLSHTFAEKFWVARVERKRVALHFPISVVGIPDGTELVPDALTITLAGADGHHDDLGVLECSNFNRATVSANTALISALCVGDTTFFLTQRNRPVTLRASLYFTLFGNARSQTIPVSDEPSNAIDGLQCYIDSVRAEWDVYCRSAFRWPSRLVYAKLGRTDAKAFAQFASYSPFPANLNIDPIETRWASAYAAGPPPNVRDVTITVEEPLEHLRRDFEARDVHLDQFAYPSFLIGPAPTPGIP